jgi:putative transcriptional regulator
MKIKHHLSDELLMAYSAGQLPEAFSLVVATHVSLCDECRARLAAFDAVGGAVLEEVGDVAMSPGSLDATMKLIRARAEAGVGPQAARLAVGAPRHVVQVFPAPLRDYVGGDLDAVRWRSLGGGVRQAILPTARDASVRLLYIPAGVAVPDHGHGGTELTQVLRGAFRDETDHFGPGDIEIATEETRHTPVAEPGEDCICLAATDAPLKFKALLPKIAQPFFRI